MPSKVIAFAAMLLVLGGVPAGGVHAQEAPRLGQDELKARLGQPGLIVIDVRASGDWAGSGEKIQGAVRENPYDFAQWIPKYPPDKTLVLYCA